MMIRRDFRDRSGGSATKHRDSYLASPDSRDQDLPLSTTRNQKNSGTPRWIRRDPAAQEMARTTPISSAISRLSRTRWRRCDFPDQHGDGATKKNLFRASTTKVDMAGLRKRRDSKSDGATGLASAAKNFNSKSFVTEVETTRLLRPRRRRRDQ